MSLNATKLSLALILTQLIAISSYAESQYVGLLAEPIQMASGYLLAQETADAYDPFVDFSEFEEVTEEEADINFFRNGRFFTLGFVGGYRGFTDSLGRMYENSINYGFFLSYFFDLRFALQLSYTTGDHNINFTSPQNTTVRGNASVSATGLHLKYYFNTQNVTRGLAQLNPYLVGGLAQVTRTSTVSGQSAFAKEGSTAFELGGGIELPMMRNKMYFGLQGTYQLVNFADENTEIELDGETGGTGIFPTGDIYQFSVILGVNF